MWSAVRRVRVSQDDFGTRRAGLAQNLALFFVESETRTPAHVLSSKRRSPNTSPGSQTGPMAETRSNRRHEHSRNDCLSVLLPRMANRGVDIAICTAVCPPVQTVAPSSVWLSSRRRAKPGVLFVTRAGPGVTRKAATVLVR